jgi:hypothetical protein
LTERVDGLTVNVGNLTGAIADYIAKAKASREVIKQNQAEIRRIGEYLLIIGGNGNTLL